MGERKPPGTDRRAALRVVAAGRVPGQLLIEQDANVVQISMGGVMMEAPMLFPVGSEHQLILRVGEQELRLSGVVRNCNQLPVGDKSALYRVGVEFLEVREDQRKLLIEFVNEKLKN